MLETIPIGPDERDPWLGCLRGALADVEAEPALATALMGGFRRMAEKCRTDEAARLP